MSHLKNEISLQNGKYRIVRMLGQGGFGITYLAIQSGLERMVAVKEFFMKNFCERDKDSNQVHIATLGSRELVERYRDKFQKEARNIARLNHPNIVRIIDVFEENGTAYYVMEYAENGSLADRVENNSFLPEQTATRYILKIAYALDYIHKQKLNHLDIKPANIMLNEKDEPVLIDFGLSKQYDATTGDQTSTTPVGISEGYAPLEQYMQGGVSVFSPETDIYSLGATFYKLLTGLTPPNASTVNDEGLPIDNLKEKRVSKNAIDVILRAMDSRKNRPKNIQAFIDGLKTENPSETNESQSVIVDVDSTTLLQKTSGKQEQKKEQASWNKYLCILTQKKLTNNQKNKTFIYILVSLLIILLFVFGVNYIPQNITNKSVQLDNAIREQNKKELYEYAMKDSVRSFYPLSLILFLEDSLISSREWAEKSIFSNCNLVESEQIIHKIDSLIYKIDDTKVTITSHQNVKSEETKGKDISKKENHSSNKEPSLDAQYRIALSKSDWSTLKSLADRGFVEAYIPLANHYLKNTDEHKLADKYAQKAKRSGNKRLASEADTIIKQLSIWGYYD